MILIFCYGYFKYALIPVAKSTAMIAESRKFIVQGQYNVAHSLLARRQRTTNSVLRRRR